MLVSRLNSQVSRVIIKGKETTEPVVGRQPGKDQTRAPSRALGNLGWRDPKAGSSLGIKTRRDWTVGNLAGVPNGCVPTDPRWVRDHTACCWAGPHILTLNSRKLSQALRGPSLGWLNGQQIARPAIPEAFRCLGSRSLATRPPVQAVGARLRVSGDCEKRRSKAPLESGAEHY